MRNDRPPPRPLMASELIKAEGLVMRDRWDQAKPHPAVGIRRDAWATFLRAVRECGLDVAAPGELGRPPTIAGKAGYRRPI